MILFFVDWQIMFMAGILLKKTAYKDSYKNLEASVAYS